MVRREPVTVVCVWNDAAVRAECLDASVQALLPSAPDTEYLPVDNRGQVHTSAGSALNSGLRAATHEYVAFVHQDVSLHSLQALEEAAGLLADDPGLGLLGAVGIRADGEIVGLVRDRVLLLGRSTRAPVEVDSLDEVLFLARRADLLADPISEHPDLAWHAYAVELGMRVRASGRSVAAVDVPLTHNSMSTNLARLDHAHAVLARMYPDQVPTRTTCGDVASPVPASERRPLLAAHRWRRRWLRDSLVARRVRAAAGPAQLVLADIRYDVDRVFDELGLERLQVLNVLPAGVRLTEPAGGVTLHRGGREVSCRAVAAGQLGEELARLRAAGDPVLVTNLDPGHLAAVELGPDDVVGLHEDLGHWLLTGAGHRAATLWTDARTRPWRLLVPAG